MINDFFDLLTSGGAQTGAAVSIAEVILIVLLSSVIGLLIAVVYRSTYRGSEYSQEFSVTLVMLCVIISVVVTAIGSNVARAFSFAGALSIIRFRTAMGNPRDIAFVLFSVSAGLCVGIGAYSYALIAVVVLFILVILMTRLNAFAPKGNNKRLKITIAENMNYEGVFDGILEKYCNFYHLKKVASTDLGTLFELVYDVEIKSGVSEKAMLDEIRCENGNLNLSLFVLSEKHD